MTTPRTRWDMAWFVVTETVGLLARLLAYSLCVLFGVNVPAVLRELWTGSPTATAGVLLGIAMWFAIAELFIWGLRETTEWVMATIEVVFKRDPD